VIIYLRMKTTKIALLGGINFAHANELLRGITLYARNKPNWELVPLHYSQESALNQLAENGKINGLIGELISDHWIKSLQTRRRIPVVNTANQSTITSSAIPDNLAIGKLAAQHFIRRHYTSLYFAGIRSYACNAMRFEGFREHAAQHNINTINLPRANLTSTLHEWMELLDAAPKPLGLFCVDDHTARRLITLCKQTSLKIPDDISIIGVGNSQLDSFFAGIGISSIDIPYATIGYEAAALLDNQLQMELGRPPREDTDNKPIKQILVPPQGLTLRETTGTGALNTLTGRAINYIESHLAAPITTQDIANHVHASKRLIEMRFQETIGRSPHAEITHLRMTKARQLLKNPHTSIADIATQCGYSEISHFYTRFKQHNNSTPPGKWRKNQLID